jgi:glycopeptide antibiotics resistance protein
MLPGKTFNIILEIIPMVILFSLVAMLLGVVRSLYNHEKINISNDFKMLMYIIYLFVLFQLVTTIDFKSFSNNFTPFKEIMRYEFTSPLFIRNVIGNIIIFIPFGYLISDIIYMNTKHKNIIIVLLFVALTSLGIETTQMYIGRSFDIDDIILNFVGGLFGYIIFLIIKSIFKEDSVLSKIVKALIMLAFIIIVSFLIYKTVI